ncbi:MAG: flagellar biosynthesis protein FlgB [Acetobacteraceae bacterium]|nr:flagellar biosynthesis protein FlgB [Acetobacteraceae bacterium]
MDFWRTPVMDLAERRLAWADQRQHLLAQNIANADTPNWQAKDLRPFDAALSRAAAAVSPIRTDPKHLIGTQDVLLQKDPTIRPAERAPDGNAVALEDELTKVADTETMQRFATNIYQKYMGLFRLACGRAQ